MSRRVAVYFRQHHALKTGEIRHAFVGVIIGTSAQQVFSAILNKFGKEIEQFGGILNLEIFV